MAACSHLDQIRTVGSPGSVCPECVALGDDWVHLRQCVVCGHVGCCDQSKNRHATAHFKSTAHPLIRSAQPGEGWGWCYVDTVFLEPMPDADGR
ncbi:UBP-type zinc finger domain-containing protein [Lysobacter sp. HA35]